MRGDSTILMLGVEYNGCVRVSDSVRWVCGDGNAFGRHEGEAGGVKGRIC